MSKAKCVHIFPDGTVREYECPPAPSATMTRAEYEALKAEERRRRQEVGGCCKPEDAAAHDAKTEPPPQP